MHENATRFSPLSDLLLVRARSGPGVGKLFSYFQINTIISRRLNAIPENHHFTKLGYICKIKI
jgi:hypothetical protein